MGRSRGVTIVITPIKISALLDRGLFWSTSPYKNKVRQLLSTKSPLDTPADIQMVGLAFCHTHWWHCVVTMALFVGTNHNFHPAVLGGIHVPCSLCLSTWLPFFRSLVITIQRFELCASGMSGAVGVAMIVRWDEDSTVVLTRQVA